MNNIEYELLCPLFIVSPSSKLQVGILEDPVQLPCCGKEVSRMQILQAVTCSSCCPLCRRDIGDTYFNTVPTLRNLVDIIEKNSRFEGMLGAEGLLGAEENIWI